MSSQTPLGRCPHCDTSIAPIKHLIEYETDDGTSVYAECPDCETVVHPVSC